MSVDKTKFKRMVLSSLEREKVDQTARAIEELATKELGEDNFIFHNGVDDSCRILSTIDLNRMRKFLDKVEEIRQTANDAYAELLVEEATKERQ